MAGDRRRRLRQRAPARRTARQNKHRQRGLADTGYRSQANEDFMAKNGLVSKVHRKKPKGRPMPDVTRRANALKSKVRSRVEHVFAVQKDRMDLFIRTIGIARATTTIGLANIVYNIKRTLFLRRTAPA
jgi:IS5 family transposase